MMLTVRARLAPVIRRRREKLRWRIADLMNKIPGQCWADLVTWALGWNERDDGKSRLPWRPITSTCRSDAANNEACYCGKIRGGQ